MLLKETQSVAWKARRFRLIMSRLCELLSTRERTHRGLATNSAGAGAGLAGPDCRVCGADGGLGISTGDGGPHRRRRFAVDRRRLPAAPGDGRPAAAHGFGT